MSDNERYREAARRSHKLLGAYLVFWAWTRKVSIVVLSREQLNSYLGVETMKRADWLEDDLKPLFPVVQWLPIAGGATYGALYLSRFPLPDEAMKGKKTFAERIEALNEAKRRTAAVETLPTESDILQIMTSLIHGISDFPDEGEDE
jgi:hypothetical protein